MTGPGTGVEVGTSLEPTHRMERDEWGTKGVADFDGIARAYRWMEYLSLGTLLERVRWHHLNCGRLGKCRRALVLGDGDGRFTARLLAANDEVKVTAVDLSGCMLELLGRRCALFADRVVVRQGDAREYVPEGAADLVVTHFFLDCLTQAEVLKLVGRVKPMLGKDALWLVSEFRIPEGWLRWPARLLVRGLYLAFRVLTGLRVTQLPDHGTVLRGCGFGVVAEKRFLGGLLVSELWELGCREYWT